jgi:hypothetical protein
MGAIKTLLQKIHYAKKLSRTAVCSTGFATELTTKSGIMHAEETGEEPGSASEP